MTVLQTARHWGLLRNLESHTFCLTGTMSVPRRDFEELIYALGGGITKIAAKADFLIVPTRYAPPSSSKYLAAARSFHTGIIDEEQFCAMILPSLEELTVTN